jgi:hypothetical protein
MPFPHIAKKFEEDARRRAGILFATSPLKERHIFIHELGHHKVWPSQRTLDLRMREWSPRYRAP